MFLVVVQLSNISSIITDRQHIQVFIFSLLDLLTNVNDGFVLFHKLHFLNSMIFSSMFLNEI